MALYENLGFANHPFAKTNADEEPQLAEYFVPPPFFDSVIGDPGTPNASIVLAPRGGGKTAQRRMVEDSAESNKFLAVTYDRFEFGAGDKVSDITLQYHLRNIIVRILISYLSYLDDYPDLLANLEKRKRQTLSLFVHSYLGDMTGGLLQEIVNELKSLPEKFKEFWRQHVGVLESVVNMLLKKYGLEAIDLPDVKQEEKKLQETYKYQLESLRDVVRSLGFKAIYLLLDKLDETEQTGNDPEATYRLLRPLIRDLELLGLEGYGFKFFLWDKIEPYYREDARPDRVHQYQLTWKMPSLQAVLTARLRAFSEGKVETFKSLLSEEPDYDIDPALCLLANGSPRNLIRICERIYAVQAEVDSNAEKIDLNSVDQGILNYCEQISIQTYGEEITKDIQRVGRELFTINYIASDVFKFTQNAARNKVFGWSNAALIKQIGTVSVGSSKKPLNFYCVIDPAVVRLIHRKIPVSPFLKDRWIPCGFCRTDNLMDINLFPENNTPICISCGRDLL